MGKYTKRADGRYATTLWIGHKKKTIYSKTIAELESKVSAIKTDLSRGCYSDDKGQTILRYGKMWLETYQTGKSHNTYAMYENIINKHLKPLHNIRLTELTKTDVQECLNKLDGHWSLQNKLRLTIRQMLDTAIDDGLIQKNVASRVTIPKKPKADTRALTDAERRALDRIDFDIEEKAFVWLLRYTGARPEEIRALTVNDINLKDRTISINKTITFNKNDSVLGPPKTDSGYRTISILTPLFSILSDYISQNDNLYLFTKRDGNIHTKSSYRKFWDRIYNKINAELGGDKEIKATDITPYVFRHDFATTLYYSGIDLKESARILGHANTQMIMEVYAELDEKKSNSTNKLEQYLKSV